MTTNFNPPDSTSLSTREIDYCDLVWGDTSKSSLPNAKLLYTTSANQLQKLAHTLYTCTMPSNCSTYPYFNIFPLKEIVGWNFKPTFSAKSVWTVYSCDIHNTTF